MTVDGPQVAPLVRPFVPDAHAVFLQILDVGIAGQKPKQFVDDRLQVQFLRGEQRESFIKCKAHLMPEDRQRAGAGAVPLFSAAAQNEFHQVEILAHGLGCLRLGRWESLRPAATVGMLYQLTLFATRRRTIPDTISCGTSGENDEHRPHPHRPHSFYAHARRLCCPYGDRRLQQNTRDKSSMDTACAVSCGLADFELRRLRPAGARPDLVARIASCRAALSGRPYGGDCLRRFFRRADRDADLWRSRLRPKRLPALQGAASDL